MLFATIDSSKPLFCAFQGYAHMSYVYGRYAPALYVAGMLIAFHLSACSFGKIPMVPLTLELPGLLLEAPEFTEEISLAKPNTVITLLVH